MKIVQTNTEAVLLLLKKKCRSDNLTELEKI